MNMRPIPNEKALKQFFNYVHSLCTSAARLWSHTAASRGRPLGGPRRGKPANVSRAASLLLAAHRPVRRDRTARVSRVGGGLTSRYVVRRLRHYMLLKSNQLQLILPSLPTCHSQVCQGQNLSVKFTNFAKFAKFAYQPDNDTYTVHCKHWCPGWQHAPRLLISESRMIAHTLVCHQIPLLQY